MVQLPSGQVAPTTAVVPTRNGAGFLGQENSTSGNLFVTGLKHEPTVQSTIIIADRLSHQGGLSGTTTGAQTTNLPTAALTRYTDGVGVMLGITIYTAVGATATTITASYTNQAGTSGQTTPLTVFGGTGFNAANRMCLLPLASGDTGVRAVASVTITASTLTAGNFGVTLFKPLAAFYLPAPLEQVNANFLDGYMRGGIPEVLDDAALFPIIYSTAGSWSGAGNVFIEEF
jgi:hypothetical protein